MRDDNAIKIGLTRLISSGVKFSDVHMCEGQCFKIRGSDVAITNYPDSPVVNREDFLDFFSEYAEKKEINLKETLAVNVDVDMSADLIVNDKEYRFRVSIYKSRELIRAVLRKNDSGIVAFEDLGFGPAAEKIRSLCRYPQGIIFVTGATGSGKSTTLASLIDIINEEIQGHIITIEDPIEFIHKDKKSVISQREVGVDCGSFGKALKSSLRQDPDVIMVGEIRDQETAEIALNAALTGHLVLATLHTNDATQTIQRFIQMFPEQERSRVQSTLAAALVAIISQALDKDLNNNRILISELMIATSGIRSTITTGQFVQLPNKITESYNTIGNYLMAHNVKMLLSQKRISPEVAKKYFDLSPDSSYKKSL